MLSFRRMLQEPKPLLPTTSEEAPAQQSAFTLLHALVAAGWKVHEGSEKDLPNIAVTAGVLPDAAKSILKSPRSHRVGRKYLAVLLELQSDASFRAFLRDHGVKSVSHGAGEKYYDTLLARQEQTLLRSDFQMDVAGASSAMQDARMAQAAVPARKGKFKLAESFQWGCVSFKYHKRGGLQVDCCRKSHVRVKDDGARILCTYSGNYKSEEERLALVRRMKYFVVQGFNDDCKTHAAHQAVKRRVSKMPLAEIPDSDALDRAMPPINRPETDDENLPAEVPAKKRALPKPKAKGKGKARQVGGEDVAAKRARGRGRGAARGSASAKPEAVPVRSPADEAASDPESSSSGSSGSSHANDDSSSSSSASSSSS